jgi:hypothetical protein
MRFSTLSSLYIKGIFLFIYYVIINNSVAGKAAAACRAQERRNRSKDKIRNTQRREIVGTDMGTKDRYITSKYFRSKGWEKSMIFVYVVCKNKRKERVFLSLTASQMTSRHLTTNTATIEDVEVGEGVYRVPSVAVSRLEQRKEGRR